MEMTSEQVKELFARRIRARRSRQRQFRLLMTLLFLAVVLALLAPLVIRP